MFYLNDRKFSDRQVWANIVDPNQIAPLGSGSALFAIPSAYFNTIVKPSGSSFRVITANVSDYRIFTVTRILYQSSSFSFSSNISLKVCRSIIKLPFRMASPW